MSSKECDSDNSSHSGEPVVCLTCKHEIGYYRGWKCGTCHKAMFCESCYWLLSYTGCQETTMGGECRQCGDCLEKHGVSYCTDVDCNCEAAPNATDTMTVKQEKKRLRREHLKNTLKLGKKAKVEPEK